LCYKSNQIYGICRLTIIQMVTDYLSKVAFSIVVS
jgi:hypothetical protein